MGRTGHVELAGTDVEFELTGEGDPVVLVHARPFVRWYAPLVAVLHGWQVLAYRRPAPNGLTVSDDATLCARLVDHVGLERPHLVGHSYGGIVAIEVARLRAVDVRSMALLEPATAGLIDPADAAQRSRPLFELVDASGVDAAMATFLRLVCGDSAESELDRLVPGAVAEATQHAAAFFATELPALIAHDIGPADVAGIAAPVLNVVGAATAPRFAEAAAIVEAWFPTSTRAEIEGATHLLMAQRPAAVGRALEAFWRGT